MSDDLVAHLVADLSPVRRLWSPEARAAVFTSSAVVGVGVGAWLAGPRTDLGVKLTEPAFVAESSVVLVSFAFSSLAALRSGVPGRERQLLAPAAAALGFGAWLLFLAWTSFTGPFAATAPGISCVVRMVALGAVPAMVLFALLRRAAPIRTGTSGFFSLLAASSVAMLGTRALCGKDDAYHLLFWHAGPIVAASLAGLVLGKRWLRQDVIRPECRERAPAADAERPRPGDGASS